MSVYWIDGVKPGRLATGPHPGDFEFLRDEGVDVVVSLLEDVGDEPVRCAEKDFMFLWLPIDDGGAPGPEADAVVKKIADLIRTGESVLVHCFGGIGRSSTIAAAVLVLLGETPAGAFERISAARGLTVPETATQRDWVHAFARRRG